MEGRGGGRERIMMEIRLEPQSKARYLLECSELCHSGLDLVRLGVTASILSAVWQFSGSQSWLPLNAPKRGGID